MKSKDLLNKNYEELEKLLVEKRKELLVLNTNLLSKGDSSKGNAKKKSVKKDIARILTILNNSNNGRIL